MGPRQLQSQTERVGGLHGLSPFEVMVLPSFFPLFQTLWPKPKILQCKMTDPTDSQCHLSGTSSLVIRMNWHRLYLKRMNHYRMGCKCLFILTGQNKKEMSENTISYWFCEVIKRAYQSSGKDNFLSQYCANEVRRRAPTLLFKRNFAVDLVLKIGF